MDNSSLYTYNIIGCLSENDDAYVHFISDNIRWSPKNETIENLNKIY